jgi:RNA polymerase sigma-70 factor (ECF subfamily)
MSTVDDIDTYDVVDTNADVFRDVVKAEQMVAMSQMFDLLADIYREVLILHYIEDKTFEEIAKIQGTTVGTVRSRKHRAVELLKQFSAEHEFVTTQM